MSSHTSELVTGSGTTTGTVEVVSTVRTDVRTLCTVAITVREEEPPKEIEEVDAEGPELLGVLLTDEDVDVDVELELEPELPMVPEGALLLTWKYP